MNASDDLLPKGTLLIIENGEYSDKNWNGPVRLLRDCKRSDLADEFRRQWKCPTDDRDWRSGPDPSDFMPWLVASGYVEHVDGVTSWHVGSYSSFEP